MIIRIETSGSSFRGAGKYYLHDKVKDGEVVPVRDQSDSRVWFTDTRNTLNIDPERALDEMWHTAEEQAYLKMQAGVRRGGRACTDPVKTISLSWHKEDAPDVQHMVDSADAFLKHMGWDSQQAVYVGHNDTGHRHIHIILNRIDHETGRTLDDYKERKRAQSWALDYEKEHGQVRCEERELRAAKRERRVPELNGPVRGADAANEPREPKPPANDHLPHNVIMLSRPLEEEFHAGERARMRDVLQEYGELKAHQRAEREAYFKDGSKLFKAARDAAYDDVRKEFKAEWRQFYKDARAAGFAASQKKDKAVADAIYSAYAGDWYHARQRFDGREEDMKAVAAQFAERKADLDARQKAVLAERQKDVCDALRVTRDVQYKEILQRQQGERAAWSAGATLDALGIGREKSETPANTASANQNQVPAAAAPLLPEAIKSEPVKIGVPEVAPPSAEPAHDKAHPTQAPAGPMPAPSKIEAAQLEIAADALAAADKALPDETGGNIDTSMVIANPPITRIADAAAIAMGSVASYLADQLGEVFAPTPPEVREAQAKAEAKRAAEKHVPEDKSNAFARQIDAAMRIVEEEKQQQDNHAYWEERDRGKGYERDQ